jgi:hypothetical protein
MKLLQFLKRLFRKLTADQSREDAESPLVSKASKDVTGKQLAMKATSPRERARERLYASPSTIKTLRIAQSNIERKKQTQIPYSQFFKHRKPTTARKLWKPNAKAEEKDN